MSGADGSGYVPAIITSAKGLPSGYPPPGAMIVSDRLFEPFRHGDTTFAHGYTFGGHPVSAAVALANLDLFEREDLLGHVRRNEGAFRATLEKLLDLPIVGDVRGDRDFYGIELVKDQAPNATFHDHETQRRPGPPRVLSRSDTNTAVVGAGSRVAALRPGVRGRLHAAGAVAGGGPADDKTEIHIPAAFPKLFKTPYDWNYSTSKQAELENRELYWPRGRTLGGSSSINAMMWVRGHQADYDGWEVPGWSYEDVVPYFKKAERREGSNAGDVYGTGGPRGMSQHRSPHPATPAPPLGGPPPPAAQPA